ncbi:MAG: DUF4339 domain-containing protein [Phycisphaeraceae bacterium]|nr:DUF4339 domain-containing protein [Phycisphaeraceae bacterium]
MSIDRRYIRVKGKIYGPASFDQLRGLVAEGRINRDDEVSLNKVDWHPAGDLQGLFPVSESEHDPYQAYEDPHEGSGQQRPESISDIDDLLKNRQPEAESPDDPAVWHVVLGPDRRTRGPLPLSQIRDMLQSRAINHQTLIWKQGMGDWRPLGQVLPDSGGGSDLSALAAARGFEHKSYGHSGHIKPDRGGVVLTFGILSLMVCFVFGIVAWTMANTDLQEMAAGRMNPSGEGMTKAGKILGIISVVLAVIPLGIFIIVFVGLLASGAALSP